jgi:hypothetical protein
VNIRDSRTTNLEKKRMNMTTTEKQIMSTKFYLADELGICPECGAAMIEIDRHDEDVHTYIWLKCSKRNCDGQWLQKKPRLFLKSGIKYTD